MPSGEQIYLKRGGHGPPIALRRKLAKAQAPEETIEATEVEIRKNFPETWMFIDNPKYVLIDLFCVFFLWLNSLSLFNPHF